MNDVTKTATEEKPARKQGAALETTILNTVRVTLDARLGTSELSVEELLALGKGSVLNLDSRLNEPIELRLNETVVARGEIVAVDDNFAIRIVEVAEGS
jgi:flagellar motor switch protein FliN/FliY